MERGGEVEPGIAELLRAVEQGKSGAFAALIDVIYPDLKRLEHSPT